MGPYELVRWDRLKSILIAFVVLVAQCWVGADQSLQSCKTHYREKLGPVRTHRQNLIGMSDLLLYLYPLAELENIE